MKRAVKTYYEAGTAEQKKLFARLEKVIRDVDPHLEVGIVYGVPTYGTKPGRVGLGYWKGGVSFYPYCGSALDEFRARYPGIKTAKGSINFTLADRVPVAALKKVIRQALRRGRVGGH